MRKSRFTESQIMAVLQEGQAGVPVAEILRKQGDVSPELGQISIGGSVRVQRLGSMGTFTLPSGTTGKTATGVLDASFIAAVLVV